MPVTRRSRTLLIAFASFAAVFGPVLLHGLLDDGAHLWALALAAMLGVGATSIMLWLDRQLQASVGIEQLQAAESRVEQLIQFNAEPQLVVNQAGRIILANQRATTFFGYSDDELRRLNVDQLVPERHRARHPGNRHAYQVHATPRSMSHREQLTALQKGGRECPVNVGLAPIDFQGEQHIVVTILDLSRQVEAARQLQRERDLRQRYLDAVEALLLAIDQEGRITLVNRYACELLGTTAEALIGQDWFSNCLPQPEAAEKAAKLYQRMMRGEVQPRLIDHSAVVARDGQQHQIRWHYRFLRDGAGQEITGVLCSGQDVTDRIKAEGLIATLQEDLRATLQALPDLLFEFDADGHYLAVHTGRDDLLAAPRESVIGRRVDDVLPAAAAQQVRAAITQTLSDGKASGDVIELAVGETGGVAHFELSCTRKLRPDGVATCLMLSRDVSERMATQAALEAYHNNLEQLVERRSRDVILANERLVHILGSSPVPIFVVDADGRVNLWNNACETYFGIPAEQIIGADTIWPAFYETSRPVLAQLVLTNDTASIERLYEARCQPAPLVEGAWQGESYFPHLKRWLAFTAVPLRDADNHIIGAVETLQDITAYKETAQALEQSRQEAEKATQAKSQFLAHMSHEIRTPLNGVIGLAQIGLRENAGRPAGRTFARIEEAGRHLLELISDILDFSKIEAGRLEIERVDFELSDFIDRLIDLTAAAATRQGLDFVIEEGEGLPATLHGDALRLMQCLINLISNAIKFTTQGEVRLRIGIVAGNLQMTVSDTGIGMTADTVERLFTPFQQGDSSTTRRFGGTGLGLSITHQLVRLMGGDILVTSQPGQGSCFIVTLPGAASTGSPDTTHYHTTHGISVRGSIRSAPEAPNTQRLTGLRLLGADDNEVNRIVLGDLLELEGATVDIVPDGQTAIDRVLAHDPHYYDAVLTDIEMPGMDGYTVARTLRARFPALPIFGLTAHASPEDREKCFAAGMNEHLTKPLDLDRLVDALHRVPKRVVSSAPVAPALPEPIVPTSATPASTSLPVEAAASEWPAEIDPSRLLEQFGGRPEFVRKLLNTAYKANVGTLEKLHQAIASGDPAAMRKLCHGLRGMSSSIGAHALHTAASAADQGDLSDAAGYAELARETASALEKLLNGLKRYLDQP